MTYLMDPTERGEVDMPKKRKRLTTKAWGWRLSDGMLASRAEALKSLWDADINESELVRVRIVRESDYRRLLTAARKGGFEG